MSQCYTHFNVTGKIQQTYFLACTSHAHFTQQQNTLDFAPGVVIAFRTQSCNALLAEANPDAQVRSSGTTQCGIVYPSARSELQTTIRHCILGHLLVISRMGTELDELRPTLLSMPLTIAPSLLSDDASTAEITQRQTIRSSNNKRWTVLYWESNSQLCYWQSPGGTQEYNKNLNRSAQSPGQPLGARQVTDI